MIDYGEPWYATVVGQRALDRVGFSTNTPRGTARAVACVNACAGIDDPAEAIKAAREAMEMAALTLEYCEDTNMRAHQCARAAQSAAAQSLKQPCQPHRTGRATWKCWIG